MERKNGLKGVHEFICCNRIEPSITSLVKGKERLTKNLE
jgi:hypothetical protein